MEAATEQDRQWLAKTLACVTPDGRVDFDALGAVEFAHDFASARAVLAAERTAGIAPAAYFILPAVVVGLLSSDESCILSVAHDRQSDGSWVAMSHPDDPHLRLPNDDALAALTALTMSAGNYDDFALVYCDAAERHPRRLCAPADSWLVRVSEALALRSTPWDLAAVDRELALARALVDLSVERQKPLLGNECGPATVSPAHLRAHGDDTADAYKCAARLFVDCDLALGLAPTVCSARQNAVRALTVFVAGVERIQATPGIYLGAIAPAIAACIGKDFETRCGAGGVDLVQPSS
ncbi:hypothetical protein psal_cds_650 [Pandoravirus salinus]|uniref:Uncharacterized protein n=1 Tax=Pandoravirus salinus TaxID=1349410 RepID=S4W281_9VIRU|nr:hypothetical protein psal_cds_650 [Pandoravirus salinus]AGO84552.1 hypothetical protein psal_cds_650 [Pandoravirus salinus]